MHVTLEELNYCINNGMTLITGGSILQGHTHAYGGYTQLVNGGIEIGSLMKEKENTSTLSEGVVKSKQENNNIKSESYLLLYIIYCGCYR